MEENTEELRLSGEERKKMDYLDYVCMAGREDLAEELKKNRKNVIALRFEKKADNDIPVGASKSGGYPDLPPDIPYPVLSEYTEKRLVGECKGETMHYAESAMQLVAQIKLADMVSYDRDDLLPKTGMLYIFWSGELDLESSSYCNYEFAGEHTAPYKVLYYDGDLSRLQRTPPPCPYYSKYDEQLESYEISPDYCKYNYTSKGLEDELEELYYEIYDGFNVSGCSNLLGFGIGSMKTLRVAGDWVNLFDFDYHRGCLWGLFWSIEAKALADRDFSDVRFAFDLD